MEGVRSRRCLLGLAQGVWGGWVVCFSLSLSFLLPLPVLRRRVPELALCPAGCAWAAVLPSASPRSVARQRVPAAPGAACDGAALLLGAAFLLSFPSFAVKPKSPNRRVKDSLSGGEMFLLLGFSTQSQTVSATWRP